MRREPTVAVAILPRLFRDALTVALRARHIQVVHVVDEPAPADVDIDLAIVCDSLDITIDARTVIKMPPEHETEAWLFRRGETAQRVPVPDLDSVVELLATGGRH